jgi:hypothetical protein
MPPPQDSLSGFEATFVMFSAFTNPHVENTPLGRKLESKTKHQT